MNGAAASAGVFDLLGWLDGERERVEYHLQWLLARLDGMPGAVADAVCYAVDGGGKRLRPILCAASYRAVSGAEDVPAPVYRIGCAIELIHTYSLIHDDLPVMDDDALRRGRQTTHRVHGASIATLAGFLLVPVSSRIADAAAAELGLEAGARAAVVRTLAEGAGASGMVGGQWLDLAGEGDDLAIDELEAVHRRKTGALIAAAARIGGIAGGAGASRLDALEAFGQRLGLAFQIADDLLDVAGDAELTGKTSGRDAALGKATYPALLGLHAARELALTEAHVAIRILIKAGLDTPPLAGLARYAVERRG